jgi:genome maintenance exonuclease 1
VITKEYDYKQLKRVTTEHKRLYTTPEGKAVPSVTTILDKTKSDEKRQALANWKKRVGTAQAQQITTEAAGRGTRMHKYLEDYCVNDTLTTPGSNPYSQQAHKMAQVIVDKGMVNMDVCWGTEVPLYYPELYAGTTDAVGVYNGQPSIIDFKQTNKPKKEEWVDDYKLQLVAYANAHNEVYGSNIKQGVILMCSKDFGFQTWTLKGEEFDLFTEHWWNRVQAYYRLIA